MKKGKKKAFTPLFGSIGEFLASHADAFGKKEAIVAFDVDKNEGRAISYNELAALAYQTANFLHKRGIRKGDRIGFALHNSAAILIIELAAGLLGASSVPLDIRRDTKERKVFKLKDGNVKILFVGTKEEDIRKEIGDIRKTLPALQVFFFEDDQSFEQMIEAEPKEPLFSLDNSWEEEYVLLYTSGTTSNPKGVPLTLGACFANAQGIIEWQQISRDDRFLIMLPLHHVNSTIMSLATILAGGTVILSSRYSASKFWIVASTYKATLTSIVPTILHDLLARKEEFLPKHYDISSLKRILIGSAPVLPLETLKFMDTFGVYVVQGYGQTETALRVCGVPITISEKMHLEMTRKNSIGIELNYCNVAILKEDGTKAKEGEEGEICIRGPILGEGYLNNPQETQKAFVDGWFHSGDLGYYHKIDGESYFFMKGRLKEIIIKGGINISPVAIEDALLKNFPELDEVCVVGYKDMRMGEDVAAVVTLKQDGSAEQRKEIADRIVHYGGLDRLTGLSRYEAPVKVFVATHALPKTSTGKVQRVKVKELVKTWMQKEKVQHYYCRLIGSEEKHILSKAVQINNKRWGVKAKRAEFEARARNGYVIGVFDEDENLQGVLSALQISEKKLAKVQTWNEVSGNGTLQTNDSKGEVLLCISISIRLLREDKMESLNKAKKRITPDKLHFLAERIVDEYVKTNLDNVIRFHRKSKGGMKEGAKVTKIIPQGRPEDSDALGYNVLMEYPEIEKSIGIIKSKQDSPSILLIEQAMMLAKEKGCTKVMAFSRPAQFRLHLEKAIGDSADFEPKNKKEFTTFAKRVRQIDPVRGKPAKLAADLSSRANRASNGIDKEFKK